MLKGDNIRIIEVKGLSPSDRTKVETYIMVEVNKLLSTSGTTWFNAHAFAAGLYKDWTGNDLIILYNNLISKGLTSTQAHRQAGHDLGKLLKKCLYDDTRMFTTLKDKKKDRCRKYKL